MNKLILFIVLLLFTVEVSPALTKTERQEVLTLKSLLQEAKHQSFEAQSSAALAEQRAADAESHATLTDSYATDLEKQVDAAHKREQTNANLVAKYKPFWDTGHSWMGIGAIVLGIGLLFKHLLIGLAFIAGLCILLWVASMFFPALGPILSAITGFFSNLWSRIFKRK